MHNPIVVTKLCRYDEGFVEIVVTSLLLKTMAMRLVVDKIVIYGLREQLTNIQLMIKQRGAPVYTLRSTGSEALERIVCPSVFAVYSMYSVC